jgi:ankyrin repeat protein
MSVVLWYYLSSCGRVADMAHLSRQSQFEVNQKDENRRTALHYACAGGSLDAVRFLLSISVEMNSVDRNGATPLMLAVGMGYFDCALFLLKSGARSELKVRISKKFHSSF